MAVVCWLESGGSEGTIFKILLNFSEFIFEVQFAHTLIEMDLKRMEYFHYILKAIILFMLKYFW